VVVGAVEVRSAVAEENGSTNEQERAKEKHTHENEDERKGVVVFPDGRVVAFEGTGPHFVK
jgi:hypothetical protein